MLLAVPASAEGFKTMAEAREVVVLSYAYGLILDSTCSRWRLNLGRAMDALTLAGIGEDDFQPGHRYNSLFMKYVTKFKPELAAMTETRR